MNIISKYIKQDDIVFLESTVYPGTTLEICDNLIRNKKKNINFLLAIVQKELIQVTKSIILKIYLKWYQ